MPFTTRASSGPGFKARMSAGVRNSRAWSTMPTFGKRSRNRSKTRTRQALGFIYYSTDAREDTAATDAYRKGLVKDLATIGKI